MRYIFLAVILLAFAAAGTYVYLGGMREPVVTTETTATPLLLAGQPYHGLVNSDKFGQIFRQAKAVQDQKQLPGATALANFYHNDPETAHDSVQAFIGLTVTDTLAKLPAGFRYRVVPAGQRVVAARLQGVSYLLSPNMLYPAALEAVKQQKLTPRGDFYLEQFGTNEASEVWVGVK